MNASPKLRLSQLFHEGSRLVCLEDIYAYAIDSGFSDRAQAPNEWFASKTLTELIEKIPRLQTEQRILTHYNKVYCSAMLAFKYAASIREDFAEELLPEIFTAKELLGDGRSNATIIEVRHERKDELRENATKRLIKTLTLISTLSDDNLYETVFTEIHKHILGFRQSLVRGLLKKEDESLFSSKTGSVREFFTDTVADLYQEAESEVADYLYRNCYTDSKPFKKESLARFLRRKSFSKKLFQNSSRVAILVKNTKKVQTQVWLHKDGSFSQILVRKDF